MLLSEICSQFVRVVSKPLQHDGQIVNPLFRVTENDGRSRIFCFNNANQSAVLLHPGRCVEDMLGIRDMDVIAAERNELRFANEFVRQMDNVSRKCRGEHAGIDVAAWEIALDLFHVRIKTHRQHAIGFIENQHPDLIQNQRAFQQMIQHPAGRADHHVRAFTQRIDLRSVAHPAI